MRIKNIYFLVFLGAYVLTSECMFYGSPSQYYRPKASEQALPKDENSCKKCPIPCPKPEAALEDLPVENKNELYEQKRSQFKSSEETSTTFSVQALEELLELAKESGDFDTHAKVYCRLKVELSTEDAGHTVVVKLKDLAVPVVVTAAVVAALSAGLTHYFVAPR